VGIILVRKEKLYRVSTYLLGFYFIVTYLDSKIEEYNMKKKKWNIISDIPNFKITSGLSTKNNKL
jgi:hypothetical protein